MAGEQDITEKDTTDWAGKFPCHWLLLVCLLASPGCQLSYAKFRPRLPSLLHRSAKIPADATKDEIVAYINQHIEPIHSWQSTTAKVRVSGWPVPLKAMLTVEQPKKLRFTVSMGLSGQSEFDVGSNPERLWFFMRRMEPKEILTVKHEELEQLQNQMPIPFQPDWLMEVLNVSTIDASSASLVRDPDNPYIAKLISHYTNAQGAEVLKSLTIDLRKGEIREHELFDAQHRLIASAELNDYKQFPNTKARLPYSIRLKLPEQDQSVHIELRSVEINPPQLPSNLWAVPQMTGYAVREIGREQILGSPAALANRKLRDKPKAITNYERDPQTGLWVKNQVIQTTHLDSAPPFSADHIQQADHHDHDHSHHHHNNNDDESIPFSTHEFSSQIPQTTPVRKQRPTALQSNAPLFVNERKQADNPPKKKKGTVTQAETFDNLPEWARGYDPEKSKKKAAPFEFDMLNMP